ncbi:profilin, required for normal timing of actin polymerization in response to thermal stress [Mortierella alpina]|nr:profilin, required for normal timing of actin polymerization in response to thermal stress [Mortierella alpina]
MSWQSYVDSNLVGSGKVAKAAIFGLDGSQWASSADFKVGAEEVKKLIAAFDKSDDISTNGLYLEGVKYVYLRSDALAIYARKGATGVTCAKTGQAVLVGFYTENMQGADCNTTVEGLADYLRSHGF